jgi:2-succinyl-5-enolpyruvyl-6-hydroxy-3-cyclohexene-1-carboxylate synthase
MAVTAAATFCATLVDEWIRLGMTDVVVAPGSRSTPMALALAARPQVHVHMVHDERSAGFMALGRSLVTHQPTPVLCTSGTAAVHFHAAVTEAHLSDVPMLVLTADRPPELRDVGAAQTIDQLALFGRSLRAFIDAGVPDDAAAHTWRALACRAWTSSVGLRHGPVQLNLPFREPLIGDAGELPTGRRGTAPWTMTFGRRGGGWEREEEAVLAAAMATTRGIIVAGHGAGSASVIEHVAAELGWPVLADPRSGCRGFGVARADAILRSAAWASQMQPDTVLRLGRPPASKVLNTWLASLDATEIVVGRSDAWIDPDSHSSIRLVGDPSMWVMALSSIANPDGEARQFDGSWPALWHDADDIAEDIFCDALDGDVDVCEPAVARAVTVVAQGSLVVSSSMPIRDVEWYGALRGDLTVHANRGANGIDGIIATAAGVATAAGGTTVLLGDVAFCHDASSLTALARRAIDLTIVVTDNDGGGIFEFLPQAGAVERSRFEKLYGTPHGTDLVHLAQAHGIAAVKVSTLDELQAEVAAVGGVKVVVIATDRVANVAVHERLHANVIAALDTVFDEPTVDQPTVDQPTVDQPDN